MHKKTKIVPQNPKHSELNASFNIEALDSALRILLYSLSETSKRQYQHTLNAWAKYCDKTGMLYSDMSAVNLIAFFEDAELSKSSKQNRLSHLRRFLQTLAASYPDDSRIKSMYEQAKLLKIQASTEEKQHERVKNALKPMQVLQAFASWSENSKLHSRNRALLAVLLYGALRRSEAAALTWADIDFENETISVRHGKGDKARTVPFLGNITEYLLEWKEASGQRVFVFCAFRKQDHLDLDRPMSDKAIYEVLRKTGDALGLDFLSPHDMRRTLLTAALANGASVADMQFIAGHSRPETTLGYAKVKDSKEVQARVKDKLPY